MSSNQLTNKQLIILEFIKDQLLTKGYPPSVREICQAVGLKSTSTVHAHLNKLEKLGYISSSSCVVINEISSGRYFFKFGYNEFI